MKLSLGPMKTTLIFLEQLGQVGQKFDAGCVQQRALDLLTELGCNENLVRLLRDVHADTWFTLSGQELIRTRRGTRPGSPLADIIFHVIMTSIMSDVNAWIAQQSTFCHLMDQMGLAPISIIWSDDVAIPWAANTPDQLLQDVAQLTVQVEHQFSRRGFELNFGPGKTNAIITFKGPRAPEFRRQHLLGESPGISCELTSGNLQWLPFVPSYKHLGAMIASTHDFAVELTHRIGQAKSAFSQLARPVLCNRHLPQTIRIRLFQTLVCSRLFFGLGAWRTPSLRQMRQLRQTFLQMIRKVMRSPCHDRVSNQTLLAKAGLADVRIYLAVDRLRYANKLFSEGPAMCQQLIHLEYARCPDSWLHGLFADIDWLRTLLPEALPGIDQLISRDLTPLIEAWSMRLLPWKSLLKRALKKHLLQERMMADVHLFHDIIFKTLRGAGADIRSSFDSGSPGDGLLEFKCDCGRIFTTAQGLSLHKRKVHQIFAPEHHLVGGAVCPHCLKFFWTSARLQQHLAYMPRHGGVNHCFAALSARGFVTEYTAVKAPPHLHGAVRLDAMQTAGPAWYGPTAAQKEIFQVRENLVQCEQELIIHSFPDDPKEMEDLLCAKLTQCTRIWTSNFVQHHDSSRMPDLGDWWMRLVLGFGSDLEEWAEFIFLKWGASILPDLQNELLDGEAEFILEAAFSDWVAVLPRPALQERQAFLRAKLERLLNSAPAGPHRPVMRGTANATERRATCNGISTLFEAQTSWQADLRTCSWHTLPPDQPVPRLQLRSNRPHFVIAHLFSGRRRVEDIHWFLDCWAERRGVDITVLSLDTAVSTHYGNLHHESTSWDNLLTCYRKGWIAATITGSPCETFSEARFQQQDQEDGRRWPRPLRSFERLFGLPCLTSRELRQLHLGSAFFLQGGLALCLHLVHGGYFISEHPAPPRDRSRPSIWTSAIIEFLLKHPDVTLDVVEQWRWGAAVPKPTGMLSLRLPSFRRSMYSTTDPDLRRPTAVAIGKHADGTFKTSEHKEYPKLFCRGVAKALTDQFEVDLRRGSLKIQCPSADELPLVSWLDQAHRSSTIIRANAAWMPDYQGN